MLEPFFPPMGVYSVVGGGVMIPCGYDVKESFKVIGDGLWFTGFGIGAIVDVPLSLIGDVLTWPIAYARRNRHPWATWWGDQGGGPPDVSTSPPETRCGNSAAESRTSVTLPHSASEPDISAVRDSDDE